MRTCLRRTMVVRETCNRVMGVRFAPGAEMNEIEAVSEWYTTSDKVIDFIFEALPYAMPVLLVIAVVWFVDGLIEYGYWLHKEDKKGENKQ